MAAPHAFLASLLLAIPVFVLKKESWLPWVRTVLPNREFLGNDRIQLQQPPEDADWEPLRKLLDGWQFTTDYAIAVGDAKHGRLFTYLAGNFTMHKQIPTGSTSKWPSAMMFAGLVNDGTIGSLNDRVSKYLPWWTKDPNDPRSRVTFRMLLSFTSGFGGGHPGEEFNTRAARDWRARHNAPRTHLRVHEKLGQDAGLHAASKCDPDHGDIMQCAEAIYSNVTLIGEPGQVYSYNSYHLQLAAGVSVAVTGLDISQVIQKYLIKPYGMHDSFYMGKCPDFGGSLVTTGADYESFMRGLEGYSTLSKSIIDASEEDATPFMSDYYTLYGDYGFGHFLMCFDSVAGFTDKCKEDKCHMDPGAFGFIPLIDRKNRYYMEVVTAQIGPSYPLSGIPEYLAVAIKPHIDAIITQEEKYPNEDLSHSPQFLSLGVADVNYCLNCVLNPKQCS